MPTPVSRVLKFVVLGAVLLCSAANLGGCYYEGGPGFSDDRFVYVSRPWEPVTVTLKDTRTGQDFWSCDVPVGRKLILYFQQKEGTGDDYTPDNMVWGLVEESYELGSPNLENNLPVPPSNSRRLDLSYRPVPELPETMVAATKGTVQPVKVQTVRPASVTMPSKPKSPPAAESPPGAKPATGEPPIDLPSQ